jgi:hypothetical protein
MRRQSCHVESAELLINRANPKRLSLHIRGTHGDGCHFPVSSEQSHDGNTIRIHAFREMPEDTACPAVVLGYTAVIELEGEFETGISLNIHINNYSFSQTI